MARRAELIQHLSGVPMFRACTKKELQAISRLMTLMDVDAGAVLTREGDRGQ